MWKVVFMQHFFTLRAHHHYATIVPFKKKKFVGLEISKNIFPPSKKNDCAVFVSFGKKRWELYRKRLYHVFEAKQKQNFHKLLWKKRFLIFVSQRLRGQFKTSNSFPQNWAFQQETKGLVWTKQFYPPRDFLVSFFTSKRLHWFAWEKEKFHFLQKF